MIKLLDNAKKTGELKHIILLVFLLVVLCAFVYGDFLSGGKFYAYTDTGRDTYNNYLPVYSYFTDVYRSGQFSFWNFEEGLGTSVFTNSALAFDPFIIMFLPFCKQTLPYVLIYAAVLKILLAVLFFYAYLSLFAFKPYAKMIGSLLFAFNGYMVLAGQHYPAATLMVFTPVLLYMYERLALRPTRLVVVMFVFTVSALLVFCPYYAYMVCVLMPLYVVVRLFTSHRSVYKDLIIRPTVFALLGAGLGAVFVFPTLYVYLTCPRVSGSFASAPVFALDSIANYQAVASRLFSNNMAFSMNFFGYDPLLYAGLITLLLVPQCFFYGRVRDRAACAVGCLIVLACLVFPYCRIVMNGFNHVTYRWTFFVVVCAIVVGTKGVDHLIAGAGIHRKTLIATTLLLLALLAALIMRLDNVAGVTRLSDVLDYGVAGVIILLYCGLLLCVNRTGRGMKLLKLGLAVLVVVDLAWASYRIVNCRDTVSPDIIQKRQGYFDYTGDVMRYLESIDRGLYRVDRSFLSVSWRDSLAHRYKGVQAANSLNQPGYIEFNQALDIPFPIGSICNIAGFGSRQNLQTLVGVKYFLAKKGHAVPYGYERIYGTGDITVYQNMHALPLGFAYDAYIDYESFSRLENHQKDEALLKAFVPDRSKADPVHLSKLSAADLSNYCFRQDISLLPGRVDAVVHGVPDSSFENAFPEKIVIQASHESPVIDITVGPGAYALCGTALNLRMLIECDLASDAVLYWKKPGEEFAAARSLDVQLRKRLFLYNFGDVTGAINHHALQLDGAGAYDLRLLLRDVSGQIVIRNVAISARYPADMGGYVEDVLKLQGRALAIQQYGSDYLRGDIRLDHPGLLFLSIPYDEGWWATVDGRETETEKVNIGFTGIRLDAGHHTVELRYVPPWMKAGKIVSLLSAVILFLICLLQKPRRLIFNEHVESKAF